jgi:hypothetical protein
VVSGSRRKYQRGTVVDWAGDDLSFKAKELYETIKKALPADVGYFLVLSRADGRATMGGNVDPGRLADIIEQVVDGEANATGQTS